MSLTNKVQQFNNDSDLVHQIANGDESTVVQTLGGPVPSLAKLMKDNQAKIDAQVSLGADLAAAAGATRVGVAGGGTLQAKLDDMAQQMANAGGVKFVNGTAPDGIGNIVIDTDDIPEGESKYFSEARVRGTVLGSVYAALAGKISVSDTIIQAISKLQLQITAAFDTSISYISGKIGFKNIAGTFTSFLQNSNTSVRTYTFPDKSGTVALTSDTGPLVFLGSADTTGNPLSIDFPNIFTNEYDAYLIQINNVLPVANGVLSMRVYSQGAEVATGYYRGTNDNSGPASSSELSLSSTSQLGYGSFSLTLSNTAVNGTAAPKLVSGNGFYQDTNSVRRIANFAAGYLTSGVAQGFRLFWSSGTAFSAGGAASVRVYGYKRS